MKFRSDTVELLVLFLYHATTILNVSIVDLKLKQWVSAYPIHMQIRNEWEISLLGWVGNTHRKPPTNIIKQAGTPKASVERLPKKHLANYCLMSVRSG